MNVTITINGDIHIHCDCCENCGLYDDDFEDSLEMPDEDADEITELPPEEAEAVIKAVAELIFPFFWAGMED
jgi:hypothetical protein